MSRSGYNDMVFPEKAAEDVFPMRGATAPPPPFQTEFSRVAARFGLDPAQLKTLIQADPGMFARMQEKYISEHRAMQNSAYNQQALQGSAQTPPFASQQAFGQMGMGQQQANFPNMAIPPPRPMTDDELREEGMKHMNPIAREKYAPVFKLLEIKIRWGNPNWVIQKAARSGAQYRQEWSAPPNDPGCSLAVWDAMVGELLDNIKKVDDGNSTDNNRTQVARN